MLYVIRHGLTDWNEAYRVQGSTDIPLNDKGRQMARDAKEKARECRFDICFASPLVRAQETAKIFLEGRDTPIITDERLREMGFGEMEGDDHIYEKSDHPMKNLFKDPANYKAVRGAESIENLSERTKDFLLDKVVGEIKKGKNVLIVGHGAMNCSIMNNIHKIGIDDFWHYMTDNCVLIEVKDEDVCAITD